MFLYDGGDRCPNADGGHHGRPAATRPPAPWPSAPATTTMNAEAFTTMIRQMVANNRAGGWRKLKRDRGELSPDRRGDRIPAPRWPVCPIGPGPPRATLLRHGLATRLPRPWRPWWPRRAGVPKSGAGPRDSYPRDPGPHVSAAARHGRPDGRDSDELLATCAPLGRRGRSRRRAPRISASVAMAYRPGGRVAQGDLPAQACPPSGLRSEPAPERLHPVGQAAESRADPALPRPPRPSSSTSTTAYFLVVGGDAAPAPRRRLPGHVRQRLGHHVVWPPPPDTGQPLAGATSPLPARAGGRATPAAFSRGR